MCLAKHGKRMLCSVEQAFVGRDEKRAPLKTPSWVATTMATFLFFFNGIFFILRTDRQCHLLTQLYAMKQNEKNRSLSV